MNIDKPHKHEINRWENDGGSCGPSVAEVVKTLDLVHVPETSKLMTNFATKPNEEYHEQTRTPATSI